MNEIKNALVTAAENRFFQMTGVAILLFPLIATAGQFIHSDYYLKTIPVLVFYWPGSSVNYTVPLPVWLMAGLFFVSYLAGIAWLLKRNNLGKVMAWTILIFICASVLKTGLSVAFGITEKPLPDLAGKANSVIFSLWHNPIWEELIFRGIPLLILLAVEKYVTKKRTQTGVLVYCLVPAVVCGWYHVPGHGWIRFFDTLLISTGFSLLALRYSFFATVVMHYIADAMMVLSLDKIKTIQPNEIEWIVQYGRSLNTFSSLCLLLLLVLIPVLTLYYYRQSRYSPK